MAPRLEYNGIVFSGLYRTKMRSRAVLDEAERTTVYVEHTLTVDGYVTLPSPGSTWEQMRKLLTACAGELYYEDHGFGAFHINGASKVRDVKWGPTPNAGALVFEPLGGNGNASRCHFEILVHIPECDDAHYQFALMALNYDVAFDLDESAYTTRTTRGYVEIPMTRVTQANRRPPDSVDQLQRYREQLQTLIPLGFHRVHQNYVVSKDRRRLDFSWVDKEIPEPLPPRVSRIDARQVLRSVVRDRLTRWHLSIDATITMARGTPRGETWDVFLRLLGSKLERLREENQFSLISTGLTIDDDLFGRSTHFTYTATCVKPAGMHLGVFLQRAKVWWPLEGGGWEDMRRGLIGASHSHVRGFAQMSYDRENDIIIDLCLPAATATASTPPGAQAVPGLQSRAIPGTRARAIPRDVPGPREPPGVAPPPGFDPGPEQVFRVRGIDPPTSWLTWDLELILEEDPRTVRHKLIPRDAPPGAPPARPLPGSKDLGTLEGFAVPAPPPDGSRRIKLEGDAESVRDATGAPSFTRAMPGEPADVFQKVSSPTRNIILRGSAIRVGWRVPVPKLLSAAGVTPVELWRRVSERVVGELGGMPVFRSEWAIVYGLPSAPAGALPFSADPVLGIDGGAGDSIGAG